MFGATLVILYVFSGIATALKPSMKVLTNSSSFLCTDEYLVVGEDFVTLEVELSGNNSDYTYTVFDGPRFRIHEVICQPFLAPVDGFCLKRDIVDTTGCSCKLVGPQIYRVKTVYRIKNVNETRVLLLWPSLSGAVNVTHYLPEIQDDLRRAHPLIPYPGGGIGTNTLIILFGPRPKWGDFQSYRIHNHYVIV
ncbi:hypothetical protein PoB_002955500 [Plakobranchus ocellatus]|uniref:Uncharacterized protein n=1 Tax=Plakobranchus ocellatus TaxID=259542 RepID=A0AAV4A6P4_9GAST|nr:hypothetical protein PoB_002955500 [Plakobranchus ocellatus]